jgi:HEAT repeat protein
MLGVQAAPIIPDLIANLSDPELSGDSANALGAIGEPALPAILETANSTNWYFRWAAAVAPTPFTNQLKATQTLHMLARDTQPEVRQAVAETIGNFLNHPESSVPLLAALLSDTTSSVRQTACTALISFGTNACSAAPALSNVMSDTALMTETARVFRQIGPKAATEIIGLLEHPSEGVRLEAISLAGGFRRYGANCLPSLLPLLKDPAAKVRERAAQIIGSHRSAATNHVTDLLPLLNDSDRDVRI